jgi:hypothetical protein
MALGKETCYRLCTEANDARVCFDQGHSSKTYFSPFSASPTLLHFVPPTHITMFLKSLVALLPVVGQSLAVNLYVSSYAGNLTTLSLQQNPDSSYRLTQTTTFNTSTNTPSWLLLNRQNNVLYMIDEANAVNGTNGTVVSYKTSFTGHLTEIQRVKSMPGGLHAAFYGSGSALAIPH